MGFFLLTKAFGISCLWILRVGQAALLQAFGLWVGLCGLANGLCVGGLVLHCAPQAQSAGGEK